MNRQASNGRGFLATLLWTAIVVAIIACVLQIVGEFLQALGTILGAAMAEGL